MRSSNPVSREYDSFNPTHQAIYRPLTVVGWKPYRPTLFQRCGKSGRVVFEAAALFVFRAVPGAIGKTIKAGLRWSGSRVHKPGMATMQAVKSHSGSQTTTQQIRL